jgi:hypothetical protein
MIQARKIACASLYIGLVLLLFPIPAYADAGIPMLAVAYPVLLLFLFPVVAIEALYLRYRLRTDWRDTWDATLKANSISMLLGYPLAWLIYFGLEILLWGAVGNTGVSGYFGLAPGSQIANVLEIAMSAAWMGGGAGGKWGRWPIPLAFILLLIPSFALSGFVESFLLGRLGWLHYEGRCARIVWQANLLSYTFLAVISAILLWNTVGNY